MPTPTKGPRLGGGPAHERLLLAGLATALFEHDRITTTEAKAKRLRPLAERMVTFAKRGDLHARRRVLTVVRDKGVVHRLFTEIAPDMEQRPGGYTRITKIGPRKGDNAPMAVIELVREPLSARQATVAEAQAATRRAAQPGAATAAALQPQAAEPSASGGRFAGEPGAQDVTEQAPRKDAAMDADESTSSTGPVPQSTSTPDDDIAASPSDTAPGERFIAVGDGETDDTTVVVSSELPAQEERPGDERDDR